jgi:hypothetical protein
MFPLFTIPQIMRNHRMPVGRRLMELWFSRPAAAYPYYSAPVTDIIKSKSSKVILATSPARNPRRARSSKIA